jgi:hypothetical protein
MVQSNDEDIISSNNENDSYNECLFEFVSDSYPVYFVKQRNISKARYLIKN